MHPGCGYWTWSWPTRQNFTNPVELGNSTSKLANSVNPTLQLTALALGASEFDASFATAQPTTGSGSGALGMHSNSLINMRLLTSYPDAMVTPTAIPATASGRPARGTTAHSGCSLPTVSHHPDDCEGVSQLVDMHNDLHAALHDQIDQCPQHTVELQSEERLGNNK